MNVLHSFAPVFDPECKVLILGSMPGDESQRQHQYYAFAHNAFWRIMSEFFNFPADSPYEERLNCLLKNHIALWDTLACCERDGSLDSNIREPVPNDIAGLLKKCPEIKNIFCNGTASWTFLKRYHKALWNVPALRIMKLPSTSPAAARYTYEEKKSAWEIVKDITDR